MILSELCASRNAKEKRKTVENARFKISRSNSAVAIVLENSTAVPTHSSA
jgi:hypothetical protein